MKRVALGLGIVLLLLIFIALKAASMRSSFIHKPVSNTITTPSPNLLSTRSPSSPLSTPQPPLDKASQRVTKKKFGTYVTPKNSPVQPERFMGYHTGVDFEILPDEKTQDVTVHAVCSGTLVLKEYASGYGGVATQSCSLNGESITVIYGHLRLSSIALNDGDSIETGEKLGVLGTGYSSETDGERKHLHLAFHKGTATNILGYVSSKDQLSDWIDPCLYVCKN